MIVAKDGITDNEVLGEPGDLGCSGLASPEVSSDNKSRVPKVAHVRKSSERP